MKNALHKLRLLSALLPLSAAPLAHSSAQTLPVPDHIVCIIFENHGYSVVMNATRAPHIMDWANDTCAAVFTNLTAMTHPSQPNYLWFYAGSNFGIVDNDIPTPLNTANLGAELYSAGKTFATYSEDLPSVGYNGESNGSYVRRHNPVCNWMGTGTNKVPDTTNKPMTAFPSFANMASLPTVSYVVPNVDNDMHDGNYFTTVTTGDTWMYNHLDSFRQWALTHNSLLVITFDEDEGISGNKIATIFYGPMVKGGTYNAKESLVNILGTFEAMYGLGHAGAPFPAGVTDTPITYCWKAVPDTTPTVSSINLDRHNELTVAPNPASALITFHYDAAPAGHITVSIIDINGRVMGAHNMTDAAVTVNTAAYPAGIYYYRCYNEAGILNEGKFEVSGH